MSTVRIMLAGLNWASFVTNLGWVSWALAHSLPYSNGPGPGPGPVHIAKIGIDFLLIPFITFYF